MTFPILGGNGAVAGYQIDNSLRFNDDDSAYLSRTPSSSGDTQKFTYSTWFKRGILSSEQHGFIGAGSSASNYFRLNLSSSNEISYFSISGGSTDFSGLTSQVFRDVSAWYHFVFSVDTTQATASDRIKLYINGSQITSFSSQTDASLNLNTDINGTTTHYIGRRMPGNDSFYDGYLAETYLIDGQALSPTDFGEFDEDSGIWKPIEYEGTYGTNGFYLDFEDSGSLGADQSGNGNNFTPTNLASTDQTTDTPTNNFATVNALDNIYNPATLSEGNLRIDFDSGTSTVYNTATVGLSTGKWYWEVNAVTIPGFAYIGIAERPCQGAGNTDSLTVSQYNYGYAASDGNIKSNSTAGTSYGDTYTSGDIIGVALDLDNNKLYVSKNGTWQNSADPSAGTGGFSIEPVANVQDSVYYPAFGDNRNGFATRMDINFGNPSYTISSGNSDANGYGNMEYSVPTGFSTICTQNLATELSPTIDDGSEYFNTVLYTGNGSTQSITGVGFQPDWTWIKRRSTTGSHALMDSSRGEDEFLESDGTAAEVTFASSNFTFTSDGYDLDYTGGYNNINQSGTTYAGWNWLANGGSTSSNTDGSITSTVQANTTAGFSIVTYTGNGTSGATVGHGLGKAPATVIIKSRDDADSWLVLPPSLGATKALNLDTTGAVQTYTPYFNDTNPTSTVFSLGNDGRTNGSSENFVAYCFAEIEGYSKFGSYTGNGSTDGTFVYTGFRPAWIMIKRTDSSGNDWIVIDTKRFTFNQISYYLRANTSDAETDQFNIDEDIVSNGFKLRGDSGNINASGSTYIYMAFAESPFVTSTGIPVTAR